MKVPKLRLVILLIILLLVIGFILMNSRQQIDKIDQQMPVIGGQLSDSLTHQSL